MKNSKICLFYLDTHWNQMELVNITMKETIVNQYAAIILKDKK